jgi:hypothetical protein
MNPFNYDPEIFLNQQPVPYQDSTKLKHFKAFNGCIIALSNKKIGLLPKLNDLDDLKITDFFSKKELAEIDLTPRDENHLTKA